MFAIEVFACPSFHREGVKPYRLVEHDLHLLGHGLVGKKVFVCLFRGVVGLFVFVVVVVLFSRIDRCRVDRSRIVFVVAVLAG
jgi:hypothetical protein